MRFAFSLSAALVLAILFPFTDAIAQTPPASGLVVNRNSGMCLEVAGGSLDPAAAVDQSTCVDLAYQRWSFIAISGGYNIVNQNSGKCLDVEGASTADGAALVQHPCQGGANQRFSFRASGDFVEVVVAHSAKCLDVTGASIDDGGEAVQMACDGGNDQKWTLSAPAIMSRWSPKYVLPLVPVAAATLKQGRILAWSAYDRFNFSQGEGKTYTVLFSPKDNSSTEKLVSNTDHDMFCPGTATLPDGRILVNGGSSSAKTSIYDPVSNTWTTGAAMNVPRGYQGDTVLSTGEVLTIGGSWSGGEGGKIGEAWTTTGGWRRLPNIVAETLSGPDPAGIYRGDNHMWLFGADNGYVFHAGPSARMNWLSTSGDGSIVNAGTRADDIYSMNGNVVMYDAGKILKLGGAPAYENTLATSAAYTVDFSRGPTQAVTTTRQKPMAFPRAFSNAVVLPNGQVVVVGGMTYPKPFYDDRSIMIPEIWTPATGAFQRLAPMTTPRNYHSVATLMLDGRVWVGGGGLCGGCPTNHPDAEILTPPYLLNPSGSKATRPVIVTAPTSAALGGLISVTTDREVASFSMIRLSAVTHSVNNDQRRVVLPISSRSSMTYQLRLPSSRGTLLAGDWMLFAMRSNGTPSIAKVIRMR